MSWNIFGFFPKVEPLYQAAQKANSLELLKLLKFLYTKNQLNEKINRLYKHDEINLISPLSLALNRELIDLNCIRYLLLYGADPSLNKRYAISGDIGNAPIHEAARKKNLAAIATLTLAGASIYQGGTFGVTARILLDNASDTESIDCFLEQLNNIQKKIKTGEQAVKNTKLESQVNIESTIIAYEKLMQKWYECHHENFLNQFKDEFKNCIIAFIEDKIALLKFELYEFIIQQYDDFTHLSDDLKKKIKYLLTDILEYANIEQLPICIEPLAGHLANLLIDTKIQKDPSITQNSPSSFKETLEQTYIVRRRDVNSHTKTKKSEESENHMNDSLVTINATHSSKTAMS